MARRHGTCSAGRYHAARPRIRLAVRCAPSSRDTVGIRFHAQQLDIKLGLNTFFARFASRFGMFSSAIGADHMRAF